MSEYQVIARKYRPKSFAEVLGQDSIVTTIKNAIKNLRIAHAYLFCGSRGTGKTTLARLFAKALNCQNPTSDFEPCNCCSSCKEITNGSSMDVLEIDGASNRGIDDIRQINETVSYAASSGKYKIYIIDEVHMLTKEAFNALLKTLEEPPAKVKFFFATTEPHKVLPTILSRCQRFNLNRIPNDKIIDKLKRIAVEGNIDIEEEALLMIANMADGGLRDAESLLDQIIAFHEGRITVSSTAAILGLMPRDTFFELDAAGKEGNLNKAFEIADSVFSQGKDFFHYLEGLVEHFRNLLLVKLAGKNAAFLEILAHEQDKYEASSKLYSQEQCMTIIDFLLQAQQDIRFAPNPKITLESLLMRIIRSHTRIPIEVIVRRLAELESKAGTPNQQSVPAPVVKERQPEVRHEKPKEKIADTPIESAKNLSISIDPTPSAADLGKSSFKETAPIDLGARLTPEAKADGIKKQSRYDTLLQFAAVELEGTIQKKQFNRF